MSWRLTLEHRDDDQGLYRRTLTLRDDGSLLLEGHDLGRGVSDIFGCSEYEFVRTIAPDQVGWLRRALGLDEGDDLGSVLADRFAGRGGSSAFEQYLNEQQIASEFWSRIGD
jgi:hypothetical protein